MNVVAWLVTKFPVRAPLSLWTRTQPGRVDQAIERAESCSKAADRLSDAIVRAWDAERRSPKE